MAKKKYTKADYERFTRQAIDDREAAKEAKEALLQDIKDLEAKKAIVTEEIKGLNAENERIKAKDPNAEKRMQQLEIQTQEWIKNNTGQKKKQVIITIPVVVHVVYNDPTENISDAQI